MLALGLASYLFVTFTAENYTLLCRFVPTLQKLSESENLIGRWICAIANHNLEVPELVAWPLPLKG